MCSGNTVTSSCSRDDDALEWSYDSMQVITLSDQSNASMIYMVDGIDFTVTLIFLNTSLTTSNISFIATPAADGKVLGCAGGAAASTATIRVVTDGKVLRNMNYSFGHKKSQIATPTTSADVISTNIKTSSPSAK